VNQTQILESLLEYFPFPQIRAEQTAALQSIAPWLERVIQRGFFEQPPLFFGCDAPTGVGKAGIAVAVARQVQQMLAADPTQYGFKKHYDEGTGKPLLPQVWVVTQNKILQDQYQKDFKDYLFDFKGLDNYPCDNDPGKSCGQSKCGRISPPDLDTPFEPPQYCTKQCGYDRVKKKAKFAPILSLNTAKAFAMLKNPQYIPPALMIVDEGHGIESALDNEATFTIDPKSLDRLGFVFERYFQDLTSLQAIMEGAADLMEQVQVQYDVEAAAGEDRDAIRIRRLQNLIMKFDEVRTSREQGVDYVSCSTTQVDLRPLRVHPVFRRIFKFPALFLSATLLSERGFRSMTGIPKEQFDWFSIGSPFPKENRPVRYGFRMGATPLNYQNSAQQMPNLFNRIDEVLTKHKGERGIIHTHTYRNAVAIYEALSLKHPGRLLFPKTAAEQKECLRLHESSRNTVLLSPSMTEGVDLKDELCRFVILVKVPYLPTNDPVVAARMDADSEWYLYRSVMTVVQASGRGVRSVDDHAVTYLCDPAFMQFIGRSRQHFPQWFLDGMERGFHGSY